MNIQTRDESIVRKLIVWEQNMEKNRTREKALDDARRAKSIREEAQKEEAALRRDFEEELRQLEKMFNEGILNLKEYLQRRAKAREKLEEIKTLNSEFDDLRKIVWNS